METAAQMTPDQLGFDRLSRGFKSGRLVKTPASRRSDPESSHQAAERLAEFRVKQYELVAGLLAAFPGEHTSLELAELSGHDRYMIARRLTDARTAGLVENGEARICKQAGTLALTWRFAAQEQSGNQEAKPMHPVEFIRRNIQKALFAQGFAPDDCTTMSDAGVNHYLTTATFPKGKVFDDCLKAARRAGRALKLKRAAQGGAES